MSISKPVHDKKVDTQDSGDYQIVVYRIEDFSEVRSVRLSLAGIYTLVSSLIVLFVALIYCLIAFTPLKRLVPGYGEIQSNQRFLELVTTVDDLSRQIDDQATYIDAMKKRTSAGAADFKEKGLLPTSTDSSVFFDQDDQVSGRSGLPRHQEVKVANIRHTDLLKVVHNKSLYPPVSGIVSSEYDRGIKHYGIDILAPAKTPVLAILDGIVFSSEWNLETGYSIGIQHSDNLLSFYKHNSLLLKEKGTFVKAGEAVAIIGNSGTLSSGPHLHFELWHNGQPVNPKAIINF